MLKNVSEDVCSIFTLVRSHSEKYVAPIPIFLLELSVFDPKAAERLWLKHSKFLFSVSCLNSNTPSIPS